jgi:pimeloyl-ACP methyl ester carboxylesterase
MHGGSTGAMAAMIPEEKIGVVVLANRGCGAGIEYMLMHDIFARMLGLPRSQTNHDWLVEAHETPAKAAVARNTRLEAARKKDTKLSLPLSRYAGTYECELYGKLEILERDGSLRLQFGPNIDGTLVHWEDDTFRAKLTLPPGEEWFLRFRVTAKSVPSLRVERISWHESMPEFRRTVKTNAMEELGKGERALKIAGLFNSEVELRRRAMFGAQLASVTKEVQDRQKLAGDGGVVLEKVFPGTTAADGDFKAGDVIVALGGAKLTGIPNFLQKVEESHAGDVLTLDVLRDGVTGTKQVTFKEMPREKGDGYDVIYSSVTSRGARLRSIITRPKAEGRHPAVMLLQGYGCWSIDNPVGTPNGFTWVARNLAQHGYVTMRVDRPGCGDSEGGPCRDVDFDTELEGYKQGLRALRQLDFVAPDNVFLFGHSQGGIVAPLIAAEAPVRGIAVYGTASGTWFESVLGQRRRLTSLDGTKAADVDREVLAQARFWYPLLVEKKTPREILNDNSELRNLGWGSDGTYVGDRHYAFHHQMADKNLAEAWTTVAATRLSVVGQVASPAAATEPLHPRVLAIWGTTDWLSTKSQHTWIAEVVNRVKPGNGTFVALDSIDHFFLRTATEEESYRYFKPVKGMPPTEFNQNILATLRPWLDETAGRAKKEPE